MRRLFVLFGSVLFSACSLSGLVFDLGGAGGAGGKGGNGASSTSSTGGSASTSSSVSSGSMPACMSNSTSGAGGGASGGVELDCTNGVDDDNDGMTDCQDPDCLSAGYSCTDVPSSWTGPVALFEGTSADNPCCPSDYPMTGPQGGSGATAQAFTCSACSCTASAKCAPAPLIVHTLAGCISDPGTSIPQDSLCPPILSGSYVQAAKPTVTLNPCVSTGGTPLTKPLATWTDTKKVCAGTNMGKGCTATQVCARPAAGVFGGKLCIYTTMVGQACPAAFPSKHSFFTKVTDTRACGGCSCANGPLPTCTVTSSIYSTNNCQGGPNKLIVDLPNDGTSCVAAFGAASDKPTVTPGNATCSSMGGGATGMVTGDTASEITVCCTP